MKVIRHTLYNLLGLGLPLIAAAFCIPFLIKELGEARFGILTLIWAVVSYFGFFDFGLGRSLTQLLSVALAKDEKKKIGPLVGTALGVMAILGIVAGGVMAIFASWGVDQIKNAPDHAEVVNAVWAMAIAMPAIILTTGFRGVLEATHAFKIINLIRLPMGVFTFIAPVVVIWLGSTRLDLIALALVVGRIIGCVAHGFYVKRLLPRETGRLVLGSDFVKPLLTSGGWMTVSNIVSPFMGYVDRFIIGSLLSAVAVAFYTTPQEMITKLWIIPGALTAVLFPAFASDLVMNNGKTKALFCRAVKSLFLVLFPVTLSLSLFADEILAVWINPEFAKNSALVMRFFAAGILINCLAHVPFTLIQGIGKARCTALVHCVELPVFILALWILIGHYGVLGAAIAWFLRMVLDAILLFGVCNKLKGWSQKSFLNRTNFLYVLLSTVAFAGSGVDSLRMRLVWFVAACFFVAIPIWDLYKQGKTRAA